MFADEFRVAGDALEYLRMARNLVLGHGFTRCSGDPFFPTAQRPPVYPYFLASLEFFGFDGPLWGGFFNVFFDLGSMFFLKKLGMKLGLQSARVLPWVVALFPPIIFLGLYPLAENLSLFLFLVGAVWFFERAFVLAGLVFGLLALCKSYWLLFGPVVGIVYFLKKEIGFKQLSKLGFSWLLFPFLWVLRNYFVLGIFTFSQSAAATLQTYIGLCIRDFDWWNEEKVRTFTSIPELAAMEFNKCQPDSEILEAGKKVKLMVSQCVTDDPWGVVQNWWIKELKGFLDWGRFYIYSPMPQWFLDFVYFGMIPIWILILYYIFRERKKPSMAALRTFWIITFGYLFLVTFPFAVDSRYFLPFMLLSFVLAFEAIFAQASSNRN